MTTFLITVERDGITTTETIFARTLTSAKMLVKGNLIKIRPV
jgi:hypothetical protein